MSTLDTLLISAIVVLAGGYPFFWRQYSALREQGRKDQQESTRLIFGLMARVQSFKREAPPPTESEWEDEPNTQVTKAQFEEAKQVAGNELNGDVTKMVKDFLNGTTTARPKP